MPSVVASVDEIASLSRNGFTPRHYPKPAESKFLLKGQPSYHHLEEKVDPWDAANQRRLLDREAEIGHMPGAVKQLATEFQQLREEERRQMEQRGLVDRLDTRKALSDAIVFIGTCQTMCPTFERIRRTYENDVKALEREADGTVSARRAVKAFSRPAAGQPPALPSDVRPPRVLMESLGYLVREIVPQLPKSQSFLWDRTRSIRQDFTYQHYSGPEAIVCNEVIVRIHLLSLHIMAGSGIEYSSQQEIEQLNKALQTLDHLYRESRKLGFQNAHEPEFRAYQLLSHLRDPEMDYLVSTLPPAVAQHPLVRLAEELRALAASASRQAQIASFFKRIRQPDVPVLFQCLAETHFVAIRLAGLLALYRSLHHRTARKYSLVRFDEMFGFDSGASHAFLDYYGVKYDGEMVLFDGFDDQAAADKKVMPQPCEQFVSARLDFSVLGFPGVAVPRGPSDLEIRQFIDGLIAKPVRDIVAKAQQHNLRERLKKKREDTARAEAAAAAERAAQEAEAARARQQAAEEAARAAAAAKEAARQQAAQRAEAERQAEQQAAAAAAHRRRAEERSAFVARTAHTVLNQLLAAVQDGVHREVSLLARAEHLNRRRLARRAFRRLRARAAAALAARDRAREAREAAAMLHITRPRRVRSHRAASVNAAELSTLFRARSSHSPAASPEATPPPAPPQPIFAPRFIPPALPLKRPADVLDMPSLRPKRSAPVVPRPAPSRVPAVPRAIQNLRNLISSALNDV